MGHFFVKKKFFNPKFAFNKPLIVFYIFVKKMAHSADFLMIKIFFRIYYNDGIYQNLLEFHKFREIYKNLTKNVIYFTLWDDYFKKRLIDYFRNHIVTT
jgi:hypothetical protein